MLVSKSYIYSLGSSDFALPEYRSRISLVKFSRNQIAFPNCLWSSVSLIALIHLRIFSVWAIFSLRRSLLVILVIILPNFSITFLTAYLWHYLYSPRSHFSSSCFIVFVLTEILLHPSSEIDINISYHTYISLSVTLYSFPSITIFASFPDRIKSRFDISSLNTGAMKTDGK